ncbi:MAG: hypothetical protein HC932_05090 [Thermales bacterium]|nr:hypothetical protein [Thermales bacterium]
MSGAYYLVYKKLQRNILSSFVWIYSTISFGSFVGYFLELLPNLSHRIVAFGFFMFATISILIARKKMNSRTQTANFVEFFALPMYIISIASGITGNFISDMMFCSVIFGLFWLGSRLESSIYYVNGFIALVVYLFYMNSEYFVDLLSWPVSLVLIGTILIATSNFLVQKRK